MTSNALTIPQQAEQSIAFAETKTKLIALVADSARIVEITNADGYKECHAARMALKNTRIEIQKTAKEARDDAIKFQKAVISKEKELVELIEPEESRLQKLQDAVDEAKEREKAAKEQAERERIEAINNRFNAIKSLPLGAVGATVERIDQILADADEIDPESFPEDLRAAAIYEQRIAIASLRAARDARVAHDAEQVRILAEREELERLRAEQAAVLAERERLANEERERQAAEARRLEEAARAERDAAERAAREAREAEQARIDAERAEQRKREDAERAKAAEKLRKEQEAAAKERAKLEAERAEAERRERESAIQSATLLTAAAEAVEFLKAEGYGSELVTQKLEAAVNRAPLKAAA